MGQAPRRGSGEPHWRAEEGPHHQAHDPHRPGRRHHTECPSEAAEQGVEGCRHPGGGDKSAYAKTLKRRATRAALNDFDRFKVMLARKSKSQKLAGAVRKMRKSAK